jgi:hypothetical protein
MGNSFATEEVVMRKFLTWIERSALYYHTIDSLLAFHLKISLARSFVITLYLLRLSSRVNLDASVKRKVPAPTGNQTLVVQFTARHFND